MVCNQCGTSLEEEAKFCHVCGAKIEKEVNQKKYCVNCGAELHGRFCTSCGQAAVGDSLSTNSGQPIPSGSVYGNRHDIGSDYENTVRQLRKKSIIGIILSVVISFFVFFVVEMTTESRLYRDYQYYGEDSVEAIYYHNHSDTPMEIGFVYGMMVLISGMILLTIVNVLYKHKVGSKNNWRPETWKIMFNLPFIIPDVFVGALFFMFVMDLIAS